MHIPDVAVIFVPATSGATQFAAACLDYCKSRGYQVLGVVTGDGDALFDMLRARQANVVVMARPEHRDPAWEPRLEFVSNAATAAAKYDNRGPASLRKRRPHRL